MNPPTPKTSTLKGSFFFPGWENIRGTVSLRLCGAQAECRERVGGIEKRVRKKKKKEKEGGKRRRERNQERGGGTDKNRKVPSGASREVSAAEAERSSCEKLRVGWLGPDQGLRREGEKEGERERTGCLGGPDGRNETQIAIIYFRRPVITEPESLRATQFLLGSKPHTAEVNIRNVKKGLTDVKEVRERKGFHFVVATIFLFIYFRLEISVHQGNAAVTVLTPRRDL